MLVAVREGGLRVGTAAQDRVPVPDSGDHVQEMVRVVVRPNVPVAEAVEEREPDAVQLWGGGPVAVAVVVPLRDAEGERVPEGRRVRL